MRTENYQSEIVDSSKRKAEYIRKADEYIQRYRKLKNIYYKIIKNIKSKFNKIFISEYGKINTSKIKQLIDGEEIFNYSD